MAIKYQFSGLEFHRRLLQIQGQAARLEEVFQHLDVEVWKEVSAWVLYWGSSSHEKKAGAGIQGKGCWESLAQTWGSLILVWTFNIIGLIWPLISGTIWIFINYDIEVLKCCYPSSELRYLSTSFIQIRSWYRSSIYSIPTPTFLKFSDIKA